MRLIIVKDVGKLILKFDTTFMYIVLVISGFVLSIYNDNLSVINFYIKGLVSLQKYTHGNNANCMHENESIHVFPIKSDIFKQCR